MTKLCKTCNEVKDVSLFVKNKLSKSGYSNKCKACTKAYRDANTDHIKTQQKAWRDNDKDYVATRRRKYRENNKEAIAESKRLWAKK